MNSRKPMSTRKIVLLSITAVVVICVVIVGVAYFKLPLSPTTLALRAALSEIVGIVNVRNSTQDQPNPVNNGYVLQSSQLLQTKEDSKVRLDLSSGSIVRIGPSTIFSLASEQTGATGGLSQIELQAGRVWIILKGGTLNVNTPAGLASVRGSYMSVWVEPNTNRITVCCLEGKCGFQDKAGDVDMTSGQKIVSSNTNAVPPVEKMDQIDVQSWLDNSPESGAIVPQITSLMASSTPSVTVTPSETATSTATMTNTSTITTTATATFTETPSPSATFTSTFTKTATYAPLFTLTSPPKPTRTKSPKPRVTNTPKPSRTPTDYIG